MWLADKCAELLLTFYFFGVEKIERPLWALFSVCIIELSGLINNIIYLYPSLKIMLYVYVISEYNEFTAYRTNLKHQSKLLYI